MNTRTNIMIFALCFSCMVNATKPTEDVHNQFPKSTAQRAFSAGVGVVVGFSYFSLAQLLTKKIIMPRVTGFNGAEMRMRKDVLVDRLRLPYIARTIENVHRDIHYINRSHSDSQQERLKVYEKAINNLKMTVKDNSEDLARNMKEYEKACEHAQKSAKNIRLMLILTAMGVGTYTAAGTAELVCFADAQQNSKA